MAVVGVVPPRAVVRQFAGNEGDIRRQIRLWALYDHVAPVVEGLPTVDDRNWLGNVSAVRMKDDVLTGVDDYVAGLRLAGRLSRLAVDAGVRSGPDAD